jgi:hypothetical protein
MRKNVAYDAGEVSSSRDRTRRPVGPMQAILLASSLLLVAAMLGSLAWLAVFGVRGEPEQVALDSPDER